MSVSIQGIGVAVPRQWIAQDDAVALVADFNAHSEEERLSLESIYKHSGIRKRHSVLLHETNAAGKRQSFYETPLNGGRGPSTAQRIEVYHREAGALAEASARDALAEAGIDAGAVTHLITVTCSGFAAPGVDWALIAHLGLPASVRRVQIGFMGCHAALNALCTAQAFCEADARAVVLVTCVELCSLHLQYGTKRERILGNALFADGAASAVVRSGSGKLPLAATGSLMLPEESEAITWRIGDHGFEMTLAQSLPRTIYTRLRPWLEQWLAEQGQDLASIQSWAVHPGGPKILLAVQGALELPEEALNVSRTVLAEYGNMSSPTLLFIIQQIMSQPSPLPCLALGFGPGLAIEAALFN